VLIQALIQAAVALLHLERGNLRGAQSVWEKARTKFKAQPANLMDLDLKEFCAALERVFIAAHEGRPTGAVPRLRLHETGAR
jgi:predicted metal-dependent hydrolase